MQRVVALCFDRVENGDAAAAEHFEIDAESAVDHFCERQRLAQRACASGRSGPSSERRSVFVEAALDDVFFADAVSGGDRRAECRCGLFRGRGKRPARNWRAAARCRWRRRAAGALRRDSRRDRAPGGRRDSRNSRSNRERMSQRGIALDGLVLAKGFEQIGERLLRNVFGANCFAQSDEDRMRRAAVIAGIEFALPPVEELEGAVQSREFRRRDRRPSGNRHRHCRNAGAARGEQPADHVEIFVVVGGEPAGVLLRCLRRSSAGRGRVRRFRVRCGATFGE